MTIDLTRAPDILASVAALARRPFVVGLCVIEAHKLYASGVSRLGAQIQDEIIMLLSSKELTDVNAPEKVKALQTQILGRANKILTKGKLTNIYFLSFVIKDKF